jgi:undecaprenyl-diphosphatase
VQTFNPGWFVLPMRALSWIGFAPQVNVITFLILLFLYRGGLRWETFVALSTAVGISVLGVGIKLLVDRPRPSADLVNVIGHLSDYSFPSGHVLYFTAFFGFVLFLVYSQLEHTWRRTLLMVILGGMVALVGLSRIYEGQHWASDVLAAYLLGSVWLALSVEVYRRFKPPDALSSD